MSRPALPRRRTGPRTDASRNRGNLRPQQENAKAADAAVLAETEQGGATGVLTRGTADQPLSTLLSRPHKDGRRLVEQIVEILSEDGRVSTSRQVLIASPTRSVIVRGGDLEDTPKLVGGSPRRVDHALGYFRSRLILKELHSLKSVVRIAKKDGKNLDQALSDAEREHPIIQRLMRADLAAELQIAMEAQSAVKEARDIFLSVAAKLAHYEWSEDPNRDPDYPMPTPLTIVKRKSLKGLYDEVFGLEP